MNINRSKSIAKYKNELTDLAMTSIIVCIDCIDFKSLATLSTLNVLIILTALNADKAPPPDKNASSNILRSTTIPSR